MLTFLTTNWMPWWELNPLDLNRNETDWILLDSTIGLRRYGVKNMDWINIDRLDDNENYPCMPNSKVGMIWRWPSSDFCICNFETTDTHLVLIARLLSCLPLCLVCFLLRNAEWTFLLILKLLNSPLDHYRSSEDKSGTDILESPALLVLAVCRDTVLY